MDLPSILAELSPQMSLVVATAAIFLLCIAFVILRGILRMMLSTAVLAACAWIAWKVWQLAPALSIECLGKPITIITWGLPILTFVLAWLIVRTIVKLITLPLTAATAVQPKKPLTLPRLAILTMLAIIPTSILWIIGATLVHHFGSVAELAEFSTPSPVRPRGRLDQHSRNLKDPIAKVMPKTILDRMDPQSEATRVKLAKWISAKANEPSVSTINPATGKPQPKTSILDDPQLQILARDGKFDSLLRHPLLTKALEDPHVQAIIKDLKL